MTLVVGNTLCYDAQMETKDILHLARLARIKIEDDEAESLKKDIESVLAYVSEVDSITADVNLTKKVGARYNIFREDVVTTKDGENTDTLLAEAPHVHGRYLEVKKILNTD